MHVEVLREIAAWNFPAWHFPVEEHLIQEDAGQENNAHQVIDALSAISVNSAPFGVDLIRHPRTTITEFSRRKCPA